MATNNFLKNKSLAYLDRLPYPEVLAEEIEENLERALGICREVAVPEK
jgi:hypothetical protein